jgi:FkbM family methyltransferase
MLNLNPLKKIVKKIPYVAYWIRVVIYHFIFVRKNMHPGGYFFSGTFLMEKGDFETEEMELFKKLLKKCDRFINVGANVGYYVCVAAKAGKPVTAFEPLQSNLKILYKNLSMNKWLSKIEIFPIAIGSKVQLNKIYGFGTGASLIKKWANSDIYHYKYAPTTTLDNCISQRFKNEKLLIIADIEGFELEMLMGAEKILNLEPKPTWIIEVTFSDHLPQEQKYKKARKVFELMWASGYRSYFADINLIEFEKEALAKIIKRKSYSALTSNFVFFDKKINPR